MSLILFNLGPLGLYKDIDDTRPRARDLCTSYATENIDYLTIGASCTLYSVLVLYIYGLISLSVGTSKVYRLYYNKP